MPTAAQQSLIEAITRALERDSRVESAWLSGSLGRGAGDEFSDVDIVAVVQGDPSATCTEYRDRLGEIAETVLARILFGRALICVTPAWDRFDLFFIAPQELARYEAGKLAPLFVRGGARPEAAGPAPEPSKFDLAITEFFRVLGLAPVGAGRGELLLMIEGVGLLRRMVIDTMLELNGSTQAERGGHLKLNPFLTAEQRAALEALPPLDASLDSAVANHIALTLLFLPCAKALAAQRGMQWPEALEQAARRRFSVYFGVAL